MITFAEKVQNQENSSLFVQNKMCCLTYHPPEGLLHLETDKLAKVAGKIECKLKTLKWVMKEFASLRDTEYIQFMFDSEGGGRLEIQTPESIAKDSLSRSVTMDDNADVAVTIQAKYSVGSIRFALSRFSTDRLNCILSMSEDKKLWIRIVMLTTDVFIQLTVSNLEENDADF